MVEYRAVAPFIGVSPMSECCECIMSRVARGGIFMIRSRLEDLASTLAIIMHVRMCLKS